MVARGAHAVENRHGLERNCLEPFSVLRGEASELGRAAGEVSRRYCLAMAGAKRSNCSSFLSASARKAAALSADDGWSSASAEAWQTPIAIPFAPTPLQSVSLS